MLVLSRDWLRCSKVMVVRMKLLVLLSVVCALRFLFLGKGPLKRVIRTACRGKGRRFAAEQVVASVDYFPEPLNYLKKRKDCVPFFGTYPKQGLHNPCIGGGLGGSRASIHLVVQQKSQTLFGVCIT